MAILSMPLRQDVPAFEYEIELEGRTWRLGFVWNTRAALWHMDVKAQDGTTLLLGLPLVVDFPLLLTYRSMLTLPPGEFFLVDLETKGEEAGRDNLGTRFLLLYYDAATVAAGAAAQAAAREASA